MMSSSGLKPSYFAIAFRVEKSTLSVPWTSNSISSGRNNYNKRKINLKETDWGCLTDKAFPPHTTSKPLLNDSN